MAKQTYEKEYINTLKSMDAKTLAVYTMSYIDNASKLQEQLTSVITEIKTMQKVLLETLKKEEK